MCNFQTASVVAKQIGIDSDTLREWRKSGKIKTSFKEVFGTFFYDIEAMKTEIHKDKKCICGNEIPLTRKRHCSKECSGKYVLRNCEKCGIEYKSTNYGSKYCSNLCASNSRSYTLKCIVCDVEYQSKMPITKYCSKACWHTKLRSEYKPKPKALIEKECGYCHEKFNANGLRKYCSGKCAKKAHNLKRKASDIVTFMTLFERDGFKCIYCGSSSILDGVKLSGDHIIPVSKGGLHSVDNIVTCCSTCNSAKNNKLLSEAIIQELLGVVAKRNAVLSLDQRAALLNIERVITGYNRPSLKAKADGEGARVRG